MNTLGVITCFLLAAFFLFAAIASKLKDYRQAKWPLVEGVVERSFIESGRVPDRGSSNRTQGFRWVYTMAYRYSVDGVAYEGSKFHNHNSVVSSYDRREYSPELSPPEWMTELAQSYIEGEEVRVFYHPKHHSNSFIVYENNWGFFFASLGFSIILFVGGIAILKVFTS